MIEERPFAPVIERLRQVGLRPTRQRLALARLLFENGDRHLTAEQLHGEAKADGIAVSLATIYNALHQFTEAGLLRDVLVESGRSYFDTNVADHFHFFIEETGELIDVPRDAVEIARLPVAPDGHAISQLNLTIRVSKKTT